MEFNLLELAAVYEALSRYEEELLSYKARHPMHDAILDGEICTVQRLLPKIKNEYMKQGGPPLPTSSGPA